MKWTTQTYLIVRVTVSGCPACGNPPPHTRSADNSYRALQPMGAAKTLEANSASGLFCASTLCSTIFLGCRHNAVCDIHPFPLVTKYKPTLFNSINADST